MTELLGDYDGGVFSALFDVSPRGNWEGHNILNLPRDPADVAAGLGIPVERLAAIAARGRQLLLERRAGRVRPARDEKILAGWNGWMLAAFAEAAMAFDSIPFRDATRRNAAFLLGTMFPHGRLHRSCKDGRVRIGALLEDVTGVAWGLLSAFEALQERRYLDAADLVLRLKRSLIDMDAFHRTGRGSHAIFHMCAFESRARRRGCTHQSMAIAQD